MSRLFKRFLLSLTLVVAMVCPALADNLEDAKTAVKKRDYNTAYSLYIPLAEQGNQEAQYALGQMYSKGLGTEQNVTTAASWYEKAADQGHLLSQVQVGRIYFLITNELVKAHKWLNVITLRKIEGAKKLQLFAKQMRNDIAKEMTPEEIEQAEKEAQDWITKNENLAKTQ
ncbi:tetratricopeptide repeat protein [Kiloniella spongiae]|uniref:tetratricopeptide repeat protein n=1 Tax=Kiloniella spongiae TaxID=1489064 RepID=UPI00069957C2|nr:tetratricopeptide repeat protein [Kiloniella spongiae]